MIKNILVASSFAISLACNNSVSTDSAGKDSVSKDSASKETPQQSSQPGAMENTLSQQEKNEGWELLFDGTSTKGWHTYGNKPVGKAWQAVDGTLHLNVAEKEAKGVGDIVTDADFDNFHLKYDWKVAVNGNSGLIFYAQEDPKYKYPWETGPEMQVLDNNGHPDAKIIKHRAGDLYDLISSSKEVVKPAMEWNTAEIKSVNGKLDFYLNGEHIVSTTLWDDNWKKMVAGSKFKNMPDFGKFQKGKLGLQDHGDNVWFRNIKIKRF